MKNWILGVGVSAGLVCGLGVPAALAQWGDGPLNTLKVGDLPGDNNIPMMAPTSDGGCYIAWHAWNSGQPGYGTRLQRLDAAGVEQWAHNGVVITPGTSTFTVVGGADLAVASDGGAIMSYDAASDPAFPNTRQANLQKISAAGVKLWGPGGAGVAVSSGAPGGTPAQVCATPDGGCIVGYTVRPSGASTYINLMRYDANGAPTWASPSFIFQSGVSLYLTDLQPAGGGSFIALWVRNQTEAALVTQKFNGNGTVAAGWAAPITLDSHGLTNRDFPSFLPDGAGGGVYAWRGYANSGFGAGSDALLQHVLSNGTLKFPQPIGSVDTTLVPANVLGRQTAALAYNQTDGTYFIASEQGPVSNGTSRSTIVQKFDSAGNRLWTGAGFVVVPESSNMQIGPGQARCVATSDGGCMVFGTVTRGFTTTKRIVFGAKVNTDGSGFPVATWNKVINSDATTDKGRIAAVNSATSDDALLAFAWGGGLGNVIAAARVSSATGAPGVTPEAPSIVANLPPTVTACEGDDVTLSVTVTGTPNIVYQWQRHYATVPDAWWVLNDGDSSFQCIIPADGTMYSGTNSPTLTVHGVHALPETVTCTAGTVTPDPSFNQYRCLVYNAGTDQVLSSEATQIVITTDCCVADIDGNGQVQVGDIFAFLSLWFGQSLDADVDGNGQVQVSDIFAFLSLWFAGC